MKNTVSYIINGILAVAIVILYVMHFTGDDSQPEMKASETEARVQSSTGDLNNNIVFVDIDSLLLHYRLSEDLNDAFRLKQQNLGSELEYKSGKFQEDYEAFVKKVQRGGFLTQQRAAEEEQKLAKRQEELQALQYNLQNKLMVEQQEMTLQLYDSIVSYVEEYNKKYNYTYILGNSQGGGLLYANKSLNITGYILEGLNARYLKDKE